MTNSGLHSFPWFLISFYSYTTSHRFVMILYSRKHDDVIKWKHFLHYWPFVRGVHRSTVESPHYGQWLGALIFSLICAWTKARGNSWDVSDLRRHRDHCDVTLMLEKAILVFRCCKKWLHPCIPAYMMKPWWRHQMETFSALLAICAGNSPVPGEFPTQRPVTRNFDVFFDLRNSWVNNGEAGDLGRNRAHHYVRVMLWHVLLTYYARTNLYCVHHK